MWPEIVDQLNGFTQIYSGKKSGTTAGVSGTAKAQATFPFIAKAEGSITPSYSTQREESESQGRTSTSKSTAISLLRASKRPLVIDDFHYLDRDQQGSIIRALKGLIFDGSPVILLAIPHRRYDAVRVEKEMTGRVEQISIPEWEPHELEVIPTLGFDILNVAIPKIHIDKFVSESLGSPHLMQDFCRAICDAHSIEESSNDRLSILPDADIKALFKEVAKSTSKTVFDRLAKGPRQRSDRKKRHFVDGTTGDIYVAVLRAIALTKPDMSSIEYEEIRAKLREILSDDPPNAQQVYRVIEKMAEISATDTSSTPVLDWDKEDRRLHVTDPFFAFFLKWGLPF